MMRILKFVTVVAAIGLWFFLNAWRGLTMYFAGDDLMNLYLAWDFPRLHLLVANLTPFTKVYRPAGAVLYRTLYAIFGLNPVPFRIAFFCLLILNIVLIYRVTRLLSGSQEIAILAALLGAYHQRAGDIYFRGSTIYDVLCFTFFALTLCVYIRARQEGAPLGPRSWAAFLALNTLALNSKEMAATLPLILIAYELLYHREPGKKWAIASAPVWVSLAMTIVVAKVRTGAGTAFTGNADYAIHISVRQFFLTTRQLMDDLFLLQPGSINTTKVILILLSIWAIAILTRRRDLVICAVMITLMPLPINFINYRGFAVMYLPMLGWAMFAAISAVAGRDWLLQHVWHRSPLPSGTWEPERVGLFLVALYVLFNLQSHDKGRPGVAYPNPDMTRVEALDRTLRQLPPPAPGSSSVVPIDQPFPDDEHWNSLYVVRLLYHDPKLIVDLADRNITIHSP